MTATTTTSTARTPSAGPSRGRVLTARVLAWFLAVSALVPFFGLIDLATLPGWVNQAYEWPVPLEVSWGSLFTFLLGGAYSWIGLYPRRADPALVLLVITAVALAGSAAGGFDLRPGIIAAVVAATAVLLGWLLAVRTRSAPRLSLHWPFFALAVAGAVLWVPYALSALEQSRAGAEGDITNGIEHWPVQGAAGLALALAAAVLALWEPARTLFRVAIGLSAGFIGMGSLAYPDRPGATEGLLWAIGVTLWGLLVLIPSPTRRPRADERTADGRARGVPAP